MTESSEGKTLQELEGSDWGDPQYPSHVVITCHRIRRIPLRDLSVEELRLAIAQKMGLEFLLPMAVRRLSQDPLARGDFFPGDLMLNVLRAPADIWHKTPELGAACADLHLALGRFFASAKQMDDSWKQSHLANFQAAHRDFIREGK